MGDASVMLEDPPDGLSTRIVLPGGHDDMHRVMVWETASLRADGAGIA